MTLTAEKTPSRATPPSSTDLERAGVAGKAKLTELQEQLTVAEQRRLPAAREKLADLDARAKLGESVEQGAIADAERDVATVEREIRALRAACETQTRRNGERSEEHLHAIEREHAENRARRDARRPALRRAIVTTGIPFIRSVLAEFSPNVDAYRDDVQLTEAYRALGRGIQIGSSHFEGRPLMDLSAPASLILMLARELGIELDAETRHMLGVVPDRPIVPRTEKATPVLATAAIANDQVDDGIDDEDGLE